MFFSFTTPATARATEEVGTSTITSTPSTSIHCRAMVEPTSGLFWWSAKTTSMVASPIFPPESSAAIFAAATEPAPARSA